MPKNSLASLAERLFKADVISVYRNFRCLRCVAAELSEKDKKKTAFTFGSRCCPFSFSHLQVFDGKRPERLLVIEKWRFSVDIKWHLVERHLIIFKVMFSFPSISRNIISIAFQMSIIKNGQKIAHYLKLIEILGLVSFCTDQKGRQSLKQYFVETDFVSAHYDKHFVF